VVNVQCQGLFRAINNRAAGTKPRPINDIKHGSDIDPANGCRVKTFIPV